jgi:hypothetical protein
MGTSVEIYMRRKNRDIIKKLKDIAKIKGKISKIDG